MDCGGKRMLTLEQVRGKFSEKGYELLVDEYINCFVKMKCRCPKGHLWKTHWNNFQTGRRCPKCAIEKNSGENHARWNPDREEVKLNMKICRRCHNLLFATFKSLGRRKTQKSRDILGYDRKNLKNHLVSHPNWSKVSNKDWQIDHIFPIKAFMDYKIYDPKIINCLENLQPLTRKDNRTKWDSYNPKEFEQWLKEKGYALL